MGAGCCCGCVAGDGCGWGLGSCGVVWLNRRGDVDWVGVIRSVSYVVFAQHDEHEG